MLEKRDGMNKIRYGGIRGGKLVIMRAKGDRLESCHALRERRLWAAAGQTNYLRIAEMWRDMRANCSVTARSLIRNTLFFLFLTPIKLSLSDLRGWSLMSSLNAWTQVWFSADRAELHKIHPTTSPPSLLWLRPIENNSITVCWSSYPPTERRAARTNERGLVVVGVVCCRKWRFLLSAMEKLSIFPEQVRTASQIPACFCSCCYLQVIMNPLMTDF